jgi:hypothetical protein
MDHSSISDALATSRLYPSKTTSDWTKLPTLASLLTGATIALIAVAFSGPIGPDSLSSYGGFPLKAGGRKGVSCDHAALCIHVSCGS